MPEPLQVLACHSSGSAGTVTLGQCFLVFSGLAYPIECAEEFMFSRHLDHKGFFRSCPTGVIISEIYVWFPFVIAKFVSCTLTGDVGY